MNRFTKACLVLGILLLAAGVALGGVSYGMGVEKDIRNVMNLPAPEMEEIMIPGQELGRLEISLVSDDVQVEVSKDKDAHIRYPVSEQFRYEFQTDRGKIRGMDRCVFQAETLKQQRMIRLDYYWRTWPVVTVSLPADYAGELKIKTVSGDVTVQRITSGNSEFATTSGDILFSEIEIGGSLDVSGTSSSVTLENVHTVSECVIKTISGDVRAVGGTFSRYQVSTTSGDVRAEEISSADWMHLQTISGDVAVRSSTIAELECKTIYGDITVRNEDRIRESSISTTSGTVITDEP